MTTIGFYLDTRRQENLGVVKLRISQKGKTSLITTGIKINQAWWNETDEKIINCPHADTLNNQLFFFKAQATALVSNLFIEGKVQRMSVYDISRLIKTNVLGKSYFNKKNRISQGFKEYIKESITDGTKEIYDRTLKKLQEFDPEFNTRTYSDITLAYIKQFEKYCLRSIAVNTLSIYMRSFRAVFNKARTEGIIDEYPFKQYKIRQTPTVKRYLTVEQLKELHAYEVEPWQEEYRDMFFLMFYLIGINVKDLLYLKKGDLHNGRIIYQRAKTGKEYTIKVEPEAQAIIDKYPGKKYLLSPLDRYANHRDYLQHLNRGLKQIGRTIGKRGKIIKPGPFNFLTSYYSRHSWATIAYALNIPIDVIGQCLGHTNRNHAITMTYIYQDLHIQDQANRKVIDRVFYEKKDKDDIKENLEADIRNLLKKLEAI